MFTSLYSSISKLFWGVAMYGLCFDGIKVHFVDGSKGTNIDCRSNVHLCNVYICCKLLMNIIFTSSIWE